MQYTEEMMQKALDNYISKLDLTDVSIFSFDVNSPIKMKVHLINNLLETKEKENKESIRKYFGLSGYIFRMYLLSKDASEEEKLDFILSNKDKLYDYAIKHINIQEVLEKDEEEFSKINRPE